MNEKPLPDLADLTALEARDRLASGAATAVELAKACLRRIADREPTIHAWAFLDEGYALAQAEALDAHRRTGRPIGPLHGLPVGIKDIIDTRDMPTENGNDLDRGRRPAEDAWLVARLRAAGALILARNAWGLWFGVGIAFLSAMMTVFVIFVVPLWAITVLALDFFVAYALLTRSDEFE